MRDERRLRAIASREGARRRISDQGATSIATYAHVVELERTLRERRVLSAFLPGAPANPAERPGWRVELDDAEHALRAAHAADSPHDRDALDRALAHLERALASAGPIVRSPAWVAYVTPDEVHLAEALPVRTPLALSWDVGARIAPLLEARKEQRPAIVALVESRMARLYRYADGMAIYLETLRAHAHVEPPVHMGNAPRQHFHPGTRGRTGTDEAERERRAGRDRMLRTLADRMVELAAPDAWLLIGGAPVAAKAAHAALPPRVASRARVMRELHLRAMPHEIATAAATGASALRRDEDLAAVRRILEALQAAGHGVVGLSETATALDERRLDQLFVSVSFVEQHPSEAERVIRQAFEQGIPVEGVAGPGGDLLDRDASGVAGRLRYAITDARSS